MQLAKNAMQIRELSQEDGGGFLVIFPDLPGCMADGETVAEALAEAADAERSWIETRGEFGLPEVR